MHTEIIISIIKLISKENIFNRNIKYLFFINNYSKQSNNTNNKNKICSLGYNLSTVIIQLMLFLLLNNYNDILLLTIKMKKYWE